MPDPLSGLDDAEYPPRARAISSSPFQLRLLPALGFRTLPGAVLPGATACSGSSMVAMSMVPKGLESAMQEVVCGIETKNGGKVSVSDACFEASVWLPSV